MSFFTFVPFRSAKYHFSWGIDTLRNETEQDFKNCKKKNVHFNYNVVNCRLSDSVPIPKSVVTLTPFFNKYIAIFYIFITDLVI